jgi:pilus assembly protein Flp/PilA
MKNKVVEFLKDESGQTSTEYILLVAVVAVVIYKFKGVLQSRLESLVGNVFDKGDDILNDIN